MRADIDSEEEKAPLSSLFARRGGGGGCKSDSLWSVALLECLNEYLTFPPDENPQNQLCSLPTRPSTGGFKRPFTALLLSPFSSVISAFQEVQRSEIFIIVRADPFVVASVIATSSAGNSQSGSRCHLMDLNGRSGAF